LNISENIIEIPAGTTIIKESCFKGRKEIQRVILPEGLTDIEENAFKGCRNLKHINFPSSLRKIGDYAFHRCHSLESAVLPDSVESIGKCAFLYCDSMKKVSAKGVKHLERQTFANNTSLTEISLNNELDTSNLGDDIFTGCVRINRILLSDGRTFVCDNLISAINSENPIVSSIAKGVYNSMKLENGCLYRFCINLKDFELPEGITSIEKGCFYDKKGIASIILPESLKRIKANSFGNCINLRKITIKNKDIIIDDNAFKGCNNLSEIVYGNETFNINDSFIPVAVKKIREQILSDFYISGNTLMIYRGSEERVSIPRGIRIISEGCFEGNDKIGKVIFPDSVEEIRENAFRNCVSVQTVELSANLKIIEKSAFENCRKLIRISFPESMKRIGKSAFKRCINLNSAEINTGLEFIGDMAFYGCCNLKNINVPEKTILGGNMVFMNSYIPENISPYRFCRDESITEINIDYPCIIGKYAFSGCPNLHTVRINNSMCIINEFAFEKCLNLRSIYINAGKIGKGSFSFCRNLEEIHLEGIENTGELSFFGCVNLKEVSLSASVKNIGDRCFEECTLLKEFPFENILSIGERSFAGCTGFKELRLPCLKAGWHSFENCCNLNKIETVSGIYLKSGAFFSCTNVNEIVYDGKSYKFNMYSQSVNSADNTFPAEVQEIIGSIYSCFRVSENYELIKYLGNSESVRIPEDIISIGDEAFRNCIKCTDIIIPESVEYIGKLAFSGTGWLDIMKMKNKITVVNNLIIDGSDCGEYAEISENIKRICSWAFAGNCTLHEIKITNPYTIIDEYAFRNCIGLRKIITADGTSYYADGINIRSNEFIPSAIKRIFTECINCFKTDEKGNLIESTGNIKNLVFVKGIKSISEGVYRDCNLLENITLSDDTTEIGNHAFENSKWLKKVGNALQVKKIGDYSFSGCQNLEYIELSENLEYIGKRCFEHCCMLKEIIIPEGISEIRERTFFRCKSLKRIVLPSTLRIIEKEAFAFCKNLSEVIISGDNMPEIGEKAFAWTKTEITGK